MYSYIIPDILSGVGYCLFYARAFQSLVIDKRTTPHFFFAILPDRSRKAINRLFMFKNVYFAVVAVLMQPYLCQGQMHALRDKILYDNVVFMSHPQSLLPYIADLSADDLLDGMVCVTTVECVDRFGKMVPGEKVSNNVIVCEHFPETKCYILKFGSNMNNPLAELK